MSMFRLMTKTEKTVLPKGAITALATPMNEDGSIDWKSWDNLLKFQEDAGIDGILVLGTTGESPTVNPKERVKLIDTAVQRFKRSTLTYVFVGTGTNDTKTTIQETKQAQKMGADAALVVTPYYNKPNKSGLLAHFDAVADIGLPVIVYDIGSRTGRPIKMDEFHEIAKHQNIIGVKAASGDIEQIKTLIKEVAYPIKQLGRDFYVWSGDDNLTIPVCEAGGDGVISVASNLIPQMVKYLALTSMAIYASGNDNDRFSLNQAARQVSDFMKKIFIETNPVPIKYSMWLAKPEIMRTPTVRSPMGLLDPNNAIEVEKAVAQISSYIR